MQVISVIQPQQICDSANHKLRNTSNRYNVDVGVVGYSKKEKDDAGNVKSIRVQLEVDFVVNRGNQRYYIQSALNVDTKEKQEQETNPLKRIGDSYRKIVIVKDDIIPWHDEKGILYIGVQEFLLNENAIDL